MAIRNMEVSQTGDGAFYARLFDSNLLKRSKTGAIHAEACRLIRREMLAAGNPEPPIRLRRVAMHLGVSNIVAAPLAMRGRIVVENGTLLIEVNEELDELSQRLTTAHELAHIVLERERISLSKAANANCRGDESHKFIEALCDYSAHEILLPRWWIEQKLIENGQQFATAVEISRISRLPLDYVVERLINLSFVSWRAIWCRRVGSAITTVRSVPDWDELFLSEVEIVLQSSSPLSRCWGTEEIVPGNVTLRIHGEVSTFRSQCFSKSPEIAVCVLYVGKA